MSDKPEPFDWNNFFDEPVTFKRLMLFNLIAAPLVGIGKALMDALLS